MPAPNILLILIDDLGWRDLACQGSPFYETPRIDALARAGCRFTEAYAPCPVCSPSRASLLTGLYPARHGITDWIDAAGVCHPLEGELRDAPYSKHLPADVPTLPALLRGAGYATWHVGKWHLGGPGSFPGDVGFDLNLGGCEWGMPQHGYFSPWQIPTLPEGTPGEYLTDHLTDRAIGLMRAHAASGSTQPFFLNMSHYAVHVPIEAPAPLVEKYRAKAARLGLDQIDPYESGEFHPTTHKAHVRVMRRRLQSDPAYAAMVENLDWNIGRLLDALAASGQAENTLVIFTSDNGGLATSEGSPTCNLPLAEGKGWMYEGGNRIPLMIHWPGHSEPRVCAAPVSNMDIFATALEAAGVTPPAAPQPDAVSLMPLLRGATDFQRGDLFWHYPHYGNQGGTPACALRSGDWKLIRFFQSETCALFNLADDPGERHDLAATHPDRVAQLRARLDPWLAATHALLPQRIR
jgi:arylsulfatase A-like enzyme